MKEIRGRGHDGEGLTFDDISLIPAYSDVLPADTDPSMEIGSDDRRIRLSTPLISAAMDTVTEHHMAAVMAMSGGLGVIHKNIPINVQAKQVRWVKDFSHGSEKASLSPRGGLLTAAAISGGSDLKERSRALVEAGVDILVLDSAHGHSKNIVEATKYLRQEYPDLFLISGNVCTTEGVHALADAGADAVKVGIGSGCFAAGTKVLMADSSHRNIEDIRAGDRVINMNGDPVTVTKAWCTGVREVVSIRHTASPIPTLATPDHRYYIGDLNGLKESGIQSSGYGKVLTRAKGKRLLWKPVSEMGRSVFLTPKKFNFELKNGFQLDLLDYSIHKGRAKNRYQTLVRDSYELGYIFGTFLGDGDSLVGKNRNSQAGAIHWTFGLEESNIAEKTADCVQSVFGARPKIVNKGNTLKLTLFSLQLARFFKEFGKHDKKHLPSKFMCSNPEYLRGIRDGLIDSDGHTEKNGRKSLHNTSPDIIHLYGTICRILDNQTPAFSSHSGTMGGLKGARGAAKTSFQARMGTAVKKRSVLNFQILRKISVSESGPEVPVFDIEVDCPTHSFIANGAIVHNSICTTRVVAGVGIPQWTAVIQCEFAADQAGISIISDGGIRNSGDVVKAFAAGAGAVMLGSYLAGSDEAPGEHVSIEGKLYKQYRGMGSASAMKRGSADRYSQSGTAPEKFVPEGVEAHVLCKGPVGQLVDQMMGGLRSGMGYLGARTLPDLWRTVRWVRVSAAGQREAHVHGVSHVSATNYNR